MQVEPVAAPTPIPPLSGQAPPQPELTPYRCRTACSGWPTRCWCRWDCCPWRSA